MARIQSPFRSQPETVLADAGYCNERDLVDLETRGVNGYVAPGREGKTATTSDPKKHPATSRMSEKLATRPSRHRDTGRRSHRCHVASTRVCRA